MECVNICIAGRTNHEYYEENKKQILEQVKPYKNEHKDKIAEYKKQYQNEHKEQLTEYHTQYRYEHKDKIAEQKKQKFTCECGIVCCINHKARHKSSLKHKKNIQNKNKICYLTYISCSENTTAG